VTPTYGWTIDSSQQQLGKAKHSSHKVLRVIYMSHIDDLNRFNTDESVFNGSTYIISTPSITPKEKYSSG
jgi:hypothetical protein